MKISNIRLLVLIFLLLAIVNHPISLANDKNLSSDIDHLVKNAMESFQVPGVAIGVILEGKVAHVKGYGVSNINTQTKVNPETIFKIASNSKAFTSAALALLVEAGKLKWSDKVHEILPEFKMKDPWITQEFNIRDLLTHRSGLRIGAGDLMLWPEPTKFTRRQVIENLRHLNSVGSFRDEYAYDNLLYIVAGEVIAKISSMSWEKFIEVNIFRPLKMAHCYAGGIDTQKIKNLAAPHAIVLSQLTLLEKNIINDQSSLMAAAGGIKCSVTDLLKWVKTQLAYGKMNGGTTFLKKDLIEEMWKPVTRLPLSVSAKKLDETNFRAYALGWRISDYHKEYKVSHTGSLSGFMSQVVMFPNIKTGFIILTNQQSSAARNSLAKGISQLLLNKFRNSALHLNKDWVEHYSSINKTKSKKKSLIVAQEIEMPSNQNNYYGTYSDPWFGEISIINKNKNVYFTSKMSPRMVGKVYFKEDKKWWVKWDDRSFEADAWLDFYLDQNGKIGLRMKAISSATDFSFDFQDLDFTKLD